MTDDLGTFTDAETVQIERIVPGPIERVWDYLTKADKLKTWIAVGEIEERVGATVTLSQDSDELPYRADHVFRGVVTACDPPHLLAWSMDDDGPPSEVSFQLEPAGDQVKLTLTHRRIPPGYLAKTAAGWHVLLHFMVSHMTGQKAQPFEDIFGPLDQAYEAQLAAAGN